MTERFSIHVTTENAVAAAEALDAAGIPHIGPTFAKFASADGAWTVGEDLTAVIEAEDEISAGRRVRRVVGSEPGVVAARPVDAPYDPDAEF